MEFHEFLLTALAVIGKPEHWSPLYEYADREGKVLHFTQASEAQRFSIRAALRFATRAVAHSREEELDLIHRGLGELAETLLTKLKEKGYLEIETKADSPVSYHLLHDFFGEVASHAAVVALFRETAKRLRDETFEKFELLNGFHRVSDHLCDAGHCGADYPGFPRHPLKCKCGGLIHLGINTKSPDFFWRQECDRCGDKFEVYELPRLIISNEK